MSCLVLYSDELFLYALVCLNPDFDLDFLQLTLTMKNYCTILNLLTRMLKALLSDKIERRDIDDYRDPYHILNHQFIEELEHLKKYPYLKNLYRLYHLTKKVYEDLQISKKVVEKEIPCIPTTSPESKPSTCDDFIKDVKRKLLNKYPELQDDIPKLPEIDPYDIIKYMCPELDEEIPLKSRLPIVDYKKTDSSIDYSKISGSSETTYQTKVIAAKSIDECYLEVENLLLYPDLIKNKLLYEPCVMCDPLVPICRCKPNLFHVVKPK